MFIAYFSPGNKGAEAPPLLLGNVVYTEQANKTRRKGLQLCRWELQLQFYLPSGPRSQDSVSITRVRAPSKASHRIVELPTRVNTHSLLEHFTD